MSVYRVIVDKAAELLLALVWLGVVNSLQLIFGVSPAITHVLACRGRCLKDFMQNVAASVKMVSDCARCYQCFKSSEALAQHLRTSQAHHVCSTCVIDFTTRLSLIQHYTSSPSHNYCQRCDTHYDTPTKLVRHIESAHNQCLLCGLSLVSHCQ